MDDYISRQNVSNWLKRYGQDVLHGKYKFSLMYIWKNLMDVPAADVAPVVHGKWADKEVIHKRCIEEWQSARCSACGKYHTTPYMYYFDDFKFCPNCGAKMDGGDGREID